MPQNHEHDTEVPVKVIDRRWWARQPPTEEGSATPDGAQDATPALKPTYVEELERKLEERDRQLQDVLARYRETSREFDDARARLRKEVAKDVERGRRLLIVEVLEVADNLERALTAGRAASPDDPLLKGVDLVYAQLLAKLEGFGVTRIDPAGQPFDPSRHEAVSTVPTGDPSRDHVVCGVVRAGYAIGDEVLRPALVAVYRGEEVV
jgi:molecular chaperone GrpE